MADIIMAGFGGQGVLTAGKILIDVAAREGMNVSWTSSYGAEMRGGTASCSVVISDEEIGSPYPTRLDVLLAMNEPSYDKFIGQMRDGGVVIVNQSLMSQRRYPDNVDVYLIPATDQANALGDGPGRQHCDAGGHDKSHRPYRQRGLCPGVGALLRQERP